jgi:transposase-like protein
MATRTPLTAAERQYIQRRKLSGATLRQIADELHCARSTARKWWRRQQQGHLPPSRGRPAQGILSTYPAALVRQAIAIKRDHPHWGPANVKLELRRQPPWQTARLPSDARLAALFKACCPEALQPRHRRQYPERPPTPVRLPHQRWQIDGKEHVVTGDQEIVTMLDVRDVAAALMIASRAIVTTTLKGWRKVTLPEVQATLRTAFLEWGMPLEIQTDHEVVYTGAPSADFPSHFTLWLVGLGITHLTSRNRRPTDQPHIERNHRTLAEMTWADATFGDVALLQAAADERRARYNTELPVHAASCHGQPPLLAHPQARHSGRPYHPAMEWTLFEMARVDRYLAALVWTRQISASGTISLGHQVYGVGRTYAHQTVSVRFVRASRSFHIQSADGTILVEHGAVGLDKVDLIGFMPWEGAKPLGWQLPLPLEGV